MHFIVFLLRLIASYCILWRDLIRMVFCAFIPDTSSSVLPQSVLFPRSTKKPAEGVPPTGFSHFISRILLFPLILLHIRFSSRLRLKIPTPDPSFSRRP